MVAPGRFDQRGLKVRPGGLLIADPDAGFSLLDVEKAGLPRPEPVSLRGLGLAADAAGALNQAFLATPDVALIEYARQGKHTVVLKDLDGKELHRLTFDTHGAVWVPDVPSTLSVGPDLAYLFFHRDGLEPLVVRLKTGERLALPAMRRSMSACPGALFSPKDPRLLAVRMHPEPHQVTLFRIRESNQLKKR
jgi:hypothetical protein